MKRLVPRTVTCQMQSYDHITRSASFLDALASEHAQAHPYGFELREPLVRYLEADEVFPDFV